MITKGLLKYTKFAPFVRGISTDIFILVFGASASDSTQLIYIRYIEVSFLFFFQINLLGFFPYYPSTGPTEYAYALLLAVMVVFGVIVTASKQKRVYFTNHFSDPSVPAWVKKFLLSIEILSFFMRILSLSLRLFANATAGGMLLKIFIILVMSLVTQIFAWLGGLGSFIMVIILLGLELAVTILQTILLTFLFSMYLKEVL